MNSNPGNAFLAKLYNIAEDLSSLDSNPRTMASLVKARLGHMEEEYDRLAEETHAYVMSRDVTKVIRALERISRREQHGKREQKTIDAYHHSEEES